MAYPIRLIAAVCLVTAGCSEPVPPPAEAAQPVGTVAPPTTPHPPTAFGTVAEVSLTDPARALIQTALDAAVVRSLGVPARVDVEILRGESDWAFVSGPATALDGTALDLSKTAMARAAKDGMMDGTNVIALLKRTNGVWSVATMQIGPTDVPQVVWPQQYGVSPALVGVEEAEGGEI